MALLNINCTIVPPWQRPPSIRIPNLGVIEQAWDAISSIPDPAEIMSKFMNTLNLALAPIRKYLQMVEVIIAIKQCVEAVPKAIMTLSPNPIFDCLKALARTIVMIMQDIPPFPYIFMAVDVAGICVDLIDAMIALIERLDAKIAALVNLQNYAAALGDLELIDLANCGLAGVKLTMQRLLDVLKIIKPINDIIIQVIMRLMPIPALQKAVEAYSSAGSTMDSTSSELSAGGGAVSATTGLPSLSLMFSGMAIARNAVAMVYNILAPFTGVDDTKPMIDPPSFQFL